jgi:hypothetical protein
MSGLILFFEGFSKWVDNGVSLGCHLNEECTTEFYTMNCCIKQLGALLPLDGMLVCCRPPLQFRFELKNITPIVGIHNLFHQKLPQVSPGTCRYAAVEIAALKIYAHLHHLYLLAIFHASILHILFGISETSMLAVIY